jgi:succinate dehydrogenase/fumarate reductase flavoprotein subunit
MHHLIGAVLAGAAAGTMTGNLTGGRPLVRFLVKGGIVAKRRIQAVAATAIAETQKLVEEARADLDQAGMEQQN